MRASICVVALTAITSVTNAAPPDVEGRAAALASAHDGIVSLSTIGTSRHGRSLRLVRLAAPPPENTPVLDADERPALLIIAGINSMHGVGVEAALAISERLAAEPPPELQSSTVYIVPMLNPDGFALHAEAGRPRTDFGRTIWPHDADRDGRVNEDPAEDLDGDGRITMMRVADPPPGSPWPATLGSDPDDARLMKAPDAAKGVTARYAVMIEGVDNDGDGKFNEDGPGGSAGGGADLDANTPYRWKEWGDGIGAYALSEPESLALVRWMLDRPNIAAVLVLGPHDSLVNIPVAGKFDDSGQVPLGIENDDKPYYEEISKAFNEITRMTGAPSADAAGSVHGWCYAHFGVWTFATPVWVRPDLVKSETDGKGANAAPDDKPADAPDKPDATPAESPASPPAPPAQSPGPARAGRRGGPPGAAGRGGGDAPKGGDGDDLKWLKYSDEHRDGAGFVEWKSFDHPQLGKVEIGGFVPGFKHIPPESDLPRLAKEQSDFTVALLKKLPRISLDAPVVESLGPSLWRITVRATNSGYLPTMPAIGAKARRAMPTLVSIEVPNERLVSGARTGRFWALPGSGGSAEHQWHVTGDPGAPLTILFKPTFGGEQAITITLPEAAR